MYILIDFLCRMIEVSHSQFEVIKVIENISYANFFLFTVYGNVNMTIVITCILDFISISVVYKLLSGLPT